MTSTWAILAILASGVAVVLGGILFLRLHAFLALILGALAVALLTPRAAIERHAIRQAALPLHIERPAGADGGGPTPAPLPVSVPAPVPDADREAVADAVAVATLLLPAKLPLARHYRLIRLRDAAVEPLGDAVVEAHETRRLPSGRSVEWSRARRLGDGPALAAGDLAIAPHELDAAARSSGQAVGERIAKAFGGTCASIGILIAMAAVIGVCLLESGAADRVVRAALERFGLRGAPAAFATSGFALGIPVFFDTVFYLMIPLGKAMRLRTGRSYLLYVLAIIAGATMAHSLVPPTPGPLFAAEALGADVGLMMLAGGAVGLVATTCGLVYAYALDRRHVVPLRESGDVSLERLEEISARDTSALPPLWLAILPVALPVVLIGCQTAVKLGGTAVPPWIAAPVGFFGDKNVALILAAAIAMAMLIRQRGGKLREAAATVQGALAGGGTIILITAAGGAFGGVIQATGVAGLVEDLSPGSPAAVLTLAFLVTTAIRTAQGSATVAMITAVGVLSGLADAGTLGFHPVWLAVAIGCGSKPILWMNDSGFWVMSKMSGMTEAETLRYVTPLLALMGVAGLLATIAGATLFPLV